MTNETEAVKPLKPQKHRSPSYPAFDLETAVQRAQQLRNIAGRHSAPVSAALNAWGYSTKSSMGSLTVAALRKFGLATVDGKLGARQLGLTNLGHELLFYGSDHNSDAWKARAREAALTPTIHSDLWKKYNGELPSDTVILPYLVLELKFSESAASELLKQFRRTIAFAQLKSADVDDIVSEHDPDDEEKKDEEERIVPPAAIATERLAQPEVPPAKPAKQAQRTVQVPYSPGEWALVQAPFPISDAAWKQMIAVLEAMKPGLVVADE